MNEILIKSSTIFHFKYALYILYHENVCSIEWQKTQFCEKPTNRKRRVNYCTKVGSILKQFAKNDIEYIMRKLCYNTWLCANEFRNDIEIYIRSRLICRSAPIYVLCNIYIEMQNVVTSILRFFENSASALARNFISAE